MISRNLISALRREARGHFLTIKAGEGLACAADRASDTAFWEAAIKRVRDGIAHKRECSTPIPGRPRYQTRQALELTIGWLALQENAFWNSGIFCKVPSTR